MDEVADSCANGHGDAGADECFEDDIALMALMVD